MSQLAATMAMFAAALVCAACRDSGADPRQTAQASAAGSVPSSASRASDIVLPGVDVSAMTPRERREWSSVVGTVMAPCSSVPVSVAQCVREGRACGGCLQAAKWVAKAVRDGASEEQIEHAYKERFDPSAARSLPLSGSPSRGPEDAPVTIVEFADFECPHCREAVPVLDAVLAAHPGKIRLVYKSYTLPFHVRGEPAARAAFAAGAQGKFWEMEHLLFERQQNLDAADLERYARILNLDVARFKADMDAPAVRQQIESDRALGEDLHLKGTPALYVNGRELDIEGDEPLETRVAGELGVPPVDLAKRDPLPAPSPAAVPAGAVTKRP